MKIRPVILCGGAGTRLWPNSKNHQAKQFIDFGNWTLLGKTLERTKVSIFDAPIISTNKKYLKEVKKHLKKNKIKKLNKVFDNKNKTVEFSDKLKDIDFDIRSFLRKNMYDHKDVQKRNDEGKKIVNFLFKKLYSNTNNNFSIQNFDQNKSRSVADFISGMTDRYAINLYEELK